MPGKQCLIFTYYARVGNSDFADYAICHLPLRIQLAASQRRATAGRRLARAPLLATAYCLKARRPALAAALPLPHTPTPRRLKMPPLYRERD